MGLGAGGGLWGCHETFEIGAVQTLGREGGGTEGEGEEEGLGVGGSDGALVVAQSRVTSSFEQEVRLLYYVIIRSKMCHNDITW